MHSHHSHPPKLDLNQSFFPECLPPKAAGVSLTPVKSKLSPVHTNHIQVNIAGIPKKELLLELLKNAEVASFFCTREPPSLDIDEIWKEYEELTRYISLVDYLRGRCLKVDISGNTMNPSTFDSEYGEGKFAEIVDKLRGRYPLPRDRKEGNNSVEDHKTN